MKKKFLPLLIILILTLSCTAGCADSQAPSVDSSAGASAVQSTAPESAPPSDPEPGNSSAPEQVTPAPQPGTETPPPADPPTPPAVAPVQPETPTPPTDPNVPAESPAQPETPGEPSADPVQPPVAPVHPDVPPVQPETPGESASPTYVYHEKVPILMYHEVNDLLANSLYLSVADFVSHLDYFEAAGITPISMQQLYDHWFNEAPIPEKPVVLTFDDGYRSMYTTVYPLLKERGWSGTFYCISAGRWSDNFVSADMIAEMAAGGMEIGSHTDNHVELDKLSADKRSRELTESKRILETITGREITALCYPAGKYNSETETASADAGYLCAVTTKSGFAAKEQGIFALRRVRVSKDCGAAWLKSTLSPLGY